MSSPLVSAASAASSIKALPQAIVDKIAAGEIVQRPSSIVKEMIENSLDADATSIEVTCEGGGLSRIKVSDDGRGMSPADLEMAAVRFATSKLATFTDLKSIRTFGFRGEALASASMVSHLSIVARQREGGGALAYQAEYEDGRLSPGSLKPTAGQPGTTVTVADLFYNMPSRLRAFKRDSEE